MTVNLSVLERLLAEATNVETWDDFYLNYATDENAELIREAVNALPALIAAVKTTETWRQAWLQTNRCRDKFGWDSEGDEACAEYQQAEDAAALKVGEALAAFSSEEQA